MEAVISAKVIETAQKVYETAKKIEKVVNVSQEMKSVAESEGKDQIDASTKLASEGKNLINNEAGKTGEKPKLDDHGPLNKDIPLTSKENSSLINAPESEIKTEKVNLWGEGIPTRIGETEVNNEVFCPRLPEKEGNLLSSNNSIVEEKSVKASSEVDKGPELETTEKRLLPKSGGYWEGVEGDSKFVPDDNVIPKDRNHSNPDGLSWAKIKEKFGFDGIIFRDGYPDFSPVSKGEVEIDNFTTERYGSGGNFDQAYKKLAEQRGCTPEEVRQWVKENNYTWHEMQDCKTMQKVPHEVHGNITHKGGISILKNAQ